MGQRAFYAVLVVVLFIAGALLGTPGRFPFLDGGEINPDFIAQLLAPLGLLATTVVTLFRSINARVQEGKVDPGDLKALVLLKEFWVGLIGAVVAVIQIFIDVEILSPDDQAILANGILVVITALLNDWSKRPAKELSPPTPTVEVTTDYPAPDVNVQVKK